MYSYDGILSSLQCHMILQKSFEYADLLVKKLIIIVENSCGNCDNSLMNKVRKNNIFSNIINVTFDQFNVSSLNENINFFQKKNLTDPSLDR